MVTLDNWVWKNEYHEPRTWREGVVVKLVKKRDKADPGNCRGITLQSTEGKTYSKGMNDRSWEQCWRRQDGKSGGQAGFRPNRSCVDHVHTFQGGKDAGLITHIIVHF